MGRAPRLLLARRQVGLGSRLGLAWGLGLGSSGLGLGSRLGLAHRLGLGSWLGLDLALRCLSPRVSAGIWSSRISLPSVEREPDRRRWYGTMTAEEPMVCMTLRWSGMDSNLPVPRENGCRSALSISLKLFGFRRRGTEVLNPLPSSGRLQTFGS